MEAVTQDGVVHDTKSTKAPKKTAKCHRLPAGTSKLDHQLVHAARMVVRRQRQLNREPGFTPVANGKVNAAIDTMTTVLLAQNAELVAQGLAAQLHPSDAQQEAIRAVAAKLPAPPRRRDTLRVRVSKNNNPEYRKN